MAEPIQSRITMERIRELFHYDELNGLLVRKVFAPPTGQIGNIILADTLYVDGEHHALARYIWLHHYGEWPPLDMLVDHIDRNHYNNLISNLRLATYTENQQNKFSYGERPKGVSCRFDGSRKKPYQARIRVNGVRILLGSFETEEEAAKAYQDACLQYHGDFACHH